MANDDGALESRHDRRGVSRRQPPVFSGLVPARRCFALAFGCRTGRSPSLNRQNLSDRYVLRRGGQTNFVVDGCTDAGVEPQDVVVRNTFPSSLEDTKAALARSAVDDEYQASPDMPHTKSLKSDLTFYDIKV
jgi:hypothetical protein